MIIMQLVKHLQKQKQGQGTVIKQEAPEVVNMKQYMKMFILVGCNFLERELVLMPIIKENLTKMIKNFR